MNRMISPGKTRLVLTALCLAFSMAVPEFAFAQGSPFETGANNW